MVAIPLQTSMPQHTRCTGMYPHNGGNGLCSYLAIVLANLVTSLNLAVATTRSLMLNFFVVQDIVKV